MTLRKLIILGQAMSGVWAIAAVVYLIFEPALSLLPLLLSHQCAVTAQKNRLLLAQQQLAALAKRK